LIEVKKSLIWNEIMDQIVQITPAKTSLTFAEWNQSPEWVKQRVPAPTLVPTNVTFPFKLVPSPNKNIESNRQYQQLTGEFVEEDKSDYSPIIYAVSPNFNAKRTKNIRFLGKLHSISPGPHDSNSNSINQTTTNSSSATAMNTYSTIVAHSPTSSTRVEKHDILRDTPNLLPDLAFDLTFDLAAAIGDIVPTPRNYIDKDIVPKKTPTKPIKGPEVPWQITNTARSPPRKNNIFYEQIAEKL
jgi:hypothetical protein